MPKMKCHFACAVVVAETTSQIECLFAELGRRHEIRPNFALDHSANPYACEVDILFDQITLGVADCTYLSRNCITYLGQKMF
jgi:hypothetical protein